MRFILFMLFIFVVVRIVISAIYYREEKTIITDGSGNGYTGIIVIKEILDSLDDK